MQINWVECRPRSVVRDLQAFRCAEPMPKWVAGGPRDVRKRHPRWWAWDVETGVHSLTIRDPGPASVFLAGWSGDDLVAVALYTETDGPAQVNVEVMAVALGYQGQGVARQLCNRTLQEIEDRALAAEVRETLVVGYIWHENIDSQRMALANKGEMIDETDGRQRWFRVLTHGQPEIEGGFIL